MDRNPRAPAASPASSPSPVPDLRDGDPRTGELRSLERRLDRLEARAESLVRDRLSTASEFSRLSAFLDLSPRAMDTLETLSKALFGELLDEIEANLTFAVREILGQDRTVTSLREVKNNRLQITFQIHSGDQPENLEDILHGQGGSVCNILSVGLRLIALSQLPPHRHRPFLVLDEQDCWLRPALVPRFMKCIAEIAKRLNLQVLVISHHPLDLFVNACDRVLTLVPDRLLGAGFGGS